nr:hypothetical protein [Tanacetum cinerariifolium]
MMPSISRRNRIHWHYVRDDALFSTIELTTAEIRNSKAYQEYYACAMGEAVPKPNVSARKKKELLWKSSDDEEVGSHEEDKESNDDSDEGSDKDSDETVKSRAGKDGDEDDDE